MSEEKLGTKETKEVLIAVNKVSLLLIKHLKDGFQAGKDGLAIVSEIMSTEELKQSLIDAAVGVSAVPAEMKDLDAQEIIELVMLQAMLVPDVMNALKKA